MRTSLPLRLSLATLAALVFVVAGAARPAPEGPFHTRLLRSAPAKDTVLASSPASVELWFSEKIELPASRVRLKNAAGQEIGLGDLTRDDRVADSPVVARILTPLAAGAYQVDWSAASKDGHPVTGNFAFTIRGN